MPRRKPPPEYCPNCGADVPPNALACPECGSDHETGWSDEATGQRIGLPDDNFDYDEFVKEEFGEEKPQLRPRGIAPLWWFVAILLLIGFVFLTLRGC
ncbi:MAG: zinc ribbon domain-containing protein [Verrucomicrobia subdivision 3 bacterium]|nr:zinc ribbon domain-containing protein [Limisphaerales bacterium]